MRVLNSRLLGVISQTFVCTTTYYIFSCCILLHKLPHFRYTKSKVFYVAVTCWQKLCSSEIIISLSEINIQAIPFFHVLLEGFLGIV